MKRSALGSIGYLATALLLPACGPHEGGIVVSAWSTLAAGSWSLAPGTEDTAWCQTITLPEDTSVSAIRPLAPPGTHHVMLSLAGEETHDHCSPLLASTTVSSLAPVSEALRMPAGVAMHLAAGEALHLHLHVLNTTSERLDGVSGIEVVRAKPDSVTSNAAFVLAGPDHFTLPAARRTTVTQTCRFLAAQTAIALIPVMHDLGVWFKATVQQGNRSIVLYDGEFRSRDQSQTLFDPVEVRAGDSVTMACTYQNTGNQPVGSDETSGEICYGALLRFPSSAALECDDDGEDDFSSGPLENVGALRIER